MTSKAPAGARAALARQWAAFGATHRRRIVLGAFLALSVAARDLVLFMVASGLFAMSELAPPPAPRVRAST